MQLYEKEFCFKLNSEPKLVNNTLKTALQFLLNKTKKQDEKIALLNSKNNNFDKNMIYREIKELENRIQKIKHK